MAKVRELIERVEPAVTMSYRQLWWVALIGAGVGVAAWLLGLLLDVALFRLIFCRDAGLEGCAVSAGYGNAAGILLATGLGIWGLVRIQAFRPLLIGIAATLTLWGVLDMLDGQPWYTTMFVALGLFAVAYALYGWVMRLRSLLWAVVISIVLLVVVRLVLNS
jgi:hypothetical protein